MNIRKTALAALILSIAAAMTACGSNDGLSNTSNDNIFSESEYSSIQSVNSYDASEVEDDTLSIKSETESSETTSSKAASSKTTSSKTTSSKSVSSKSTDSKSASSVTSSKSVSSISNFSSQEKTVSMPEKQTENISTVSESEEITVDYEQMYRDFMNSGTWRNYKNSFSESDASTDRCNIAYSNIFDMDGDGIPELLLYADSDITTPRPMTVSGFYTIKNNEIEPLLTGGTSGGTIGGETISLAEDSDTGNLYVGSFGSIGGFGGTGGYTSIYSYSSGELHLVTEFKATKYDNPSLGTDEFKIDSADVSEDEYRAILEKYKMIFPKDVSSRI